MQVAHHPHLCTESHSHPFLLDHVAYRQQTPSHAELAEDVCVQGAVSGLHMMRCFEEAGFPKGLISAVTGKGSEIGDFLTMHPGVNCIR